jgi:hypothetical protein
MKKHFLAAIFIFTLTAAHAQIINTIAGTGLPGHTGDGGPATAANFKYVGGVGVDTAGNVYITDGNFTMRKVNTAGIITAFAGIAGSSGPTSGDGGPATAARIAGCLGIAFDKKGNVYIADPGAKTIRKIDAAGIITRFAGNGATTAYGDGGPATAAGLGNGTNGVCFDNAGNMYIDAHGRIRKVDTFGIISTYGGVDTFGYSGDGGPAIAAKLGGEQLATDTKGNLYIAEGGNHRIRKINVDGIITTIAGNGIAGYSGDGGAATAAQLSQPYGVFADRCGNIYIGEFLNNRIRKVDTNGIISTVVGNGYGGSNNISTWTGAYNGDGGPATAAELYGPGTVAMDKLGGLYLIDDYNHVVRYVRLPPCDSVAAVDTAIVIDAVPHYQQAGAAAVYPNPTTGTFTIQGAMPAASPGEIKVEIIDRLGKILPGKTVAVTTSGGTLTITVNTDLPDGVYYLRMVSSRESKVVKFRLQR